MKPEYDVFLPANDGYTTTEEAYPFTITVMKGDGTLVTRTVENHQQVKALKPYAAFKIHRPDPLVVLTQQVTDDTFLSKAFVTKVLTYLNKRGLLKVDGQPKPTSRNTDWLDEKMDKLNICYSNQRIALRNWFNDPEGFPEVNFDIKNRILTVKSVGGGRVIVLPTGHTLAYTAAKAIYNEFIGNKDWMKIYNKRQITVGEYVNGYIRHRKMRVDITTLGVTVGCQTVPREAIMDLAEREGW